MQDTEAHPPPSQASLAAWLRLAEAPGVGILSAQRLLGCFTTPEAIFGASHTELASCVPARLARILASDPDPAWRARIDAALAWAALPGHHLLPFGHADYPYLLREIPDPPVLLYAIGKVALLGGPALAMVGSRNASTQGVRNARAFARAMSGAGLTIVSGLALGIDAAAHEGALMGIGSTVAVVGTGIDRIYPPRNEALARQIAEQGCIVSEYSLGAPPVSANFPRRNRLISGLCSGVLVVEAAAQSGSLITAHAALEQGRDVFAIPGSIHAPLSKGCHLLIKEGAKLVECAADILRELCPQAPLAAGAEPAPLVGQHAALLAALGQGPVDMDTLAGRTGLGAGALASGLLSLELADQVERLPGGLFQRLNL